MPNLAECKQNRGSDVSRSTTSLRLVTSLVYLCFESEQIHEIETKIAVLCFEFVQWRATGAKSEPAASSLNLELLSY